MFEFEANSDSELATGLKRRSQVRVRVNCEIFAAVCSTTDHIVANSELLFASNSNMVFPLLGYGFNDEKVSCFFAQLQNWLYNIE